MEETEADHQRPLCPRNNTEMRLYTTENNTLQYYGSQCHGDLLWPVGHDAENATSSEPTCGNDSWEGRCDSMVARARVHGSVELRIGNVTACPPDRPPDRERNSEERRKERRRLHQKSDINRANDRSIKRTHSRTQYRSVRTSETLFLINVLARRLHGWIQPQTRTTAGAEGPLGS